MFNFTSVRCPDSHQYLFLHAFFIPPSTLHSFFPLPLQALSYSTLLYLGKGKILQTIGEEILMLLSLEKDWKSLPREAPGVQLIETFRIVLLHV